MNNLNIRTTTGPHIPIAWSFGALMHSAGRQRQFLPARTTPQKTHATTENDAKRRSLMRNKIPGQRQFWKNTAGQETASVQTLNP